MPDAKWLSRDGQIIRRDPESDAYYATLIIHRDAFLDEARAAKLARLMAAIAPPGDFPKIVGVRVEIVETKDEVSNS